MVKARRIIWCVFIVVATMHMLMRCIWVVSATRMPSFTPFLAPRRQDMRHLMGFPHVPKEEEAYRRLSRLGSNPPNCNHKCRGCMPCYPIQVPTTTDQLGLQSTNYEPEGWKCKCGSSIFNP